MNTSDYKKLNSFAWDGESLHPENDKAKKLTSDLKPGECLYLKPVQSRDLDLHKRFFILLGYIYSLTGAKFKRKIKKADFLNYIQYGLEHYKVRFTTGDGQRVIEFDSISFGNMSQSRFEKYLSELLPFVYANIIAHYWDIETAAGIVEAIKKEFKTLIDTIETNE